MLTQEELLDQVTALCPKIDLGEEDVDIEVLEQRGSALVAWAQTLPESAIAPLLALILLPQEAQNELSPNGNGNEICGIAIDAIVVLGPRYPETAAAAFVTMLNQEDTVGLALEGIELWEDSRMLPEIAALIERTTDPENGYLICQALFAIDGEEALQQLKRLQEKFADDEGLAEHIQSTIHALEEPLVLDDHASFPEI
jgi:hypothetical protein